MLEFSVHLVDCRGEHVNNIQGFAWLIPDGVKGIKVRRMLDTYGFDVLNMANGPSTSVFRDMLCNMCSVIFSRLNSAIHSKGWSLRNQEV